VELFSFGLLCLLFFESFLSLEIEVSLSNDRGILGLKVPDFPADLCSNSDPMATRVEGQAVDGGSSIMARGRLLDITEVKHLHFFVLSSSNNEVSSRRDSDSIDTAFMDFNTVLNVEGLVVPDFEVAVPSN